MNFLPNSIEFCSPFLFSTSMDTMFRIGSKITFFPGNIRRFRRICEHIQSQVCSKRFSGPGSPPRVTNAVSESSSCGSDSSERLSCYKRQVKYLLFNFCIWLAKDQ